MGIWKDGERSHGLVWFKFLSSRVPQGMNVSVPKVAIIQYAIPIYNDKYIRQLMICIYIYRLLGHILYRVGKTQPILVRAERFYKCSLFCHDLSSVGFSAEVCLQAEPPRAGLDCLA